MTTKIILHECPACGYRCDRVTGANNNDAPKPGDATICIDCGALSEFDHDMAPVLVSDARRALPEFAECRALQREVRYRRGLPV